MTRRATNKPTTSSDISPGFFGRADELQVLQDAIAERRCVVVSGPPGVGKTQLVREFLGGDDGWHRVVIGSSPDAGNAWRRLADSLDADPPQTDVESLARATGAALAARGVDGLLVDDADALSDGADGVEALRSAAGGLPVIVVARRRIPVRGAEHIRLEGLTPEAAVDLYVHEAARAGVSTEAELDRGAIEAFVRSVDGLPLGVRLAAARAHLVSAKMMLERMERGAATTRKLDQSIGVAWELLDTAEAACARQLAIFESDFTLEAAEAVVDLPEEHGPEEHGPEEHGEGVVDVVGRLIDASWLRRVPGGPEPRFESWSPLRQFASRQLETSGEERAVGRRFIGFFRRRALAMADAVSTPRGVETLAAMRRDREHFVRAVELALPASNMASAEIAWSLRWLARTASDPETFRALLTRVLDTLDPSADPLWIARLSSVVGELTLRTGDRDGALEHLEHAFGIANERGDDLLRARLIRASCLALASVDPGACEERLREGLELADRVDATVLSGRLRERLGFVQLQTFRLEEARQSFSRAKRAISTRANEWLAAPATTGLAYVALRTGHLPAASTSFEEAVEVFERAGDIRREAEARFNHAVALHAERDLDAARAEFEAALERWDACGEERFQSIARGKLGLLLAECGEFDAATKELRVAIGAGQRVGDWHNRAIAEAALVLLGLLRVGPTTSPTSLASAVDEMSFPSDPDAAAASVCALAVLHSSRRDEEEARAALDRLRGIRSLLAQQDVLLRRVIDGLYALARGWVGELLPAARDDIALERDDLLRHIPSLLDDEEQAREEARQLQNPYMRLVYAAYVDWHRPAEDTAEFLDTIRPESARRVLTVHREAHWFRIDERDPVNLLSRQPLRRVLRSILSSHLEKGPPGRGVEELIEHGWPGEFVTPSAGKNRVYTAIRSLRDMGLENILVTSDAGYRFAEDVAVELTDARFES